MTIVPDPEQIRAMLTAISPDDAPFEIRVLKCRKRTPNGLIDDPYVKAQSGFFTDVETAVSAARRFTGNDAAGVYVTINDLPHHVLSWGSDRIAKGRATSDADVLRYRHLYIDVDPVRPSDTNATEQEREVARTRASQLLTYLRDSGWPDPVWAGNSGSGAMLLFRIDLAPDAQPLIRRVLQGLHDLFSDDAVGIDTSVFNPARVVRLAGTVNAKAITPQPERPWTLATGKALPNPGAVTRAQLEAIAAAEPTPVTRDAFTGDRYDLARILTDSGIPYREKVASYGTVYALDDCLTSADHADGACFIQFHSGTVAYRCLHSRCSGKGWHDVKPFLTLPEPRTGATVNTGKGRAAPDDPTDYDEPKPPRVAVVQSLADIEAKAIDWHWRGWLARSMLTIFGGYAGDGKSTIAAALAAAFSTGGILPDGSRAPVVNSLFLSAEEDPQYALKPRLALHKANHGRVFTMRGTRDGDGPIKWADLKTDMPAIRAVVEQRRIGVLWIDPISSYLPGTDRNSEGNIRDGLSGLQDLMQDTGVAVVGIAHVGKGDGTGRRAEQRLLGSTAFSALARCVWMLTNLPDEHQPESAADDPADRRKVFGVAKANYSLFPQSLMFARPLDGPIKWLGPSPVSIVEAFATKPEQGHKGRDAEEWLAERLAGGAQRSEDVTRAAELAGISDRTLRRARAALNVRRFRDKSGWYVQLPPGGKVANREGGQPETDTRHLKELAAFHNVQTDKGGHPDALAAFPSYQGKLPPGHAPGEGLEHGQTDKGGQITRPQVLAAFVPSEPAEPLDPTGTNDGWEVF